MLTCLQDFNALKVKCGQWADKCRFLETGKGLSTLLDAVPLNSGNAQIKSAFH